MSKIIDLTGEKFNHLTVIERGPNTSHGLAQWWCKCDCGNKCLVRGSCLRNGHTQSCGCLAKKKSAENGRKLLKDLTDKEFGNLRIIKYIPEMKKWECQCRCGNVCYVSQNNLTRKTAQNLADVWLRW